jgi:hypothetical protein
MEKREVQEGPEGLQVCRMRKTVPTVQPGRRPEISPHMHCTRPPAAGHEKWMGVPLPGGESVQATCPPAAHVWHMVSHAAYVVCCTRQQDLSKAALLHWACHTKLTGANKNISNF